MSNKFDEYWDELVRKYRSWKGLSLAPDQLAREIASVNSIPLSDEEIDSIVSVVSAGESGHTNIRPNLSWIDEIDTSSIEEGVLQLNRNKGESDADFKRRLEELRKKALEEGSDDKDDVEAD